MLTSVCRTEALFVAVIMISDSAASVVLQRLVYGLTDELVPNSTHVIVVNR